VTFAGVTALLLVGAAACSGGGGVGPRACSSAFAGDPGQDMTLEIVTVAAAGGAGAPAALAAVADGDRVPLYLPPQGGRIILAGARATNVDPCSAVLLGVVRDMQTQQVRLDSRSVNLLPAGDGNRVESDARDISTLANVPVCPNSWSKSSIYGADYQLEVTLTDRAGRSATVRARIDPVCSAGQGLEECRCICRAGYVLGQTCPDTVVDAGAGDESDGG
jgi:hypothetical protein